MFYILFFSQFRHPEFFLFVALRRFVARRLLILLPEKIHSWSGSACLSERVGRSFSESPKYIWAFILNSVAQATKCDY